MSLRLIMVAWFFLLSIYWLTYILFRKGKLNTRTVLLFLLNILLFVTIIYLFYASFARFGFLNSASFNSILIMGVAGIIHHIVVIINMSDKQTRLSELVHEPLSHYLFFILLGINSTYFGINVFEFAETVFDKLTLIILIIATIAVSIIGFFKRTRIWFFKSKILFE